MQPTAILQLHVVANDEVDQGSEDKAGEGELQDGDRSEDDWQHCKATTDVVGVLRNLRT